jgi:hypothetical protein
MRRPRYSKAVPPVSFVLQVLFPGRGCGYNVSDFGTENVFAVGTSNVFQSGLLTSSGSAATCRCGARRSAVYYARSGDLTAVVARPVGEFCK